MAAMAGQTEKKTIIGLKVTPERKKRILGRCEGLKCNYTDYPNTLIDKDLDSAGPGPSQTVKAAEPGATSKEIVQGRLRDITYVIDGDKPGNPVKAVVVDGKEFRYCDKCKKFARKGDDGKDQFWP